MPESRKDPYTYLRIESTPFSNGGGFFYDLWATDIIITHLDVGAQDPEGDEQILVNLIPDAYELQEAMYVSFTNRKESDHGCL